MWSDLMSLFGEKAKDKPGDLAMSGVGLLAVAAVIGLIAWWFLKGGLSIGSEVLSASRDRTTRTEVRATYWLVAIGGVAGLLALILGAIGVLSLAKAAIRRPAPRPSGDRRNRY